MSGDCQYVTSSSVRVDIVTLLSEREVATADLIDKVDASSSAVYSALSDLDNRGLIRETDSGWELTGRGLIVADTVSHRQSTEAFLAHDTEYWQDRRTDVLPKRFRLRLPEIGDYEIIRLEPPDVNRLETEVINRINAVDSCRVVSHIYKRPYEEQLTSPETQVLLTPNVIDELIEKVDAGQRETVMLEPTSQVRVATVEFGLTWTADSICLHLPPQTVARATAMLVSDTETAIQWGRELFEGLWLDAQPLAAYLDAQGVDTERR